MPAIFAKAAARGAIAMAIVVVAWELAATALPSFVMPHLGPVLGKTVELASSADFWTHALASASRILVGYLMALVVGVPLGLALRQVPELRFAFGALFAGLAAVPFVLLVPVTILWFGIGSRAPIALAFAAAGFALVSGLMAVPNSAKPVAPGGMPPTVAAVPLAPQVVEAARTALLVAVGAVLVSEMIGSQAGFGYLVMYATSTFDVATMFAVVIIVALPCAFISALLRAIEVQAGI